MTNRAKSSYANVIVVAGVFYMRGNSHVICKMESGFFSVVENYMTLSQNEREVHFKVCVCLLGRIRRHSVFSSFNCNLFSIIQYFKSEMHISMEEIAL